eukprot:CAMPEP_0115548200 /NCGR_PEP_ID=MMETSP0271-20121206/94042_1 /TAXON_ID=71861 /ORGANISM="Scrippsiella trochoidea, Strain CCMP3099" /LENGTH=229 /DNA_ID=CAMNT_0002981661 /DNA_START=207 /DNA_END=897 /DNA_ORIENTATION=+
MTGNVVFMGRDISLGSAPGSHDLAYKCCVLATFFSGALGYRLAETRWPNRGASRLGVPLGILMLFGEEHERVKALMSVGILLCILLGTAVGSSVYSRYGHRGAHGALLPIGPLLALLFWLHDHLAKPQKLVKRMNKILRESKPEGRSRNSCSEDASRAGNDAGNNESEDAVMDVELGVHANELAESEDIEVDELSSTRSGNSSITGGDIEDEQHSGAVSGSAPELSTEV